MRLEQRLERAARSGVVGDRLAAVDRVLELGYVGVQAGDLGQRLAASERVAQPDGHRHRAQNRKCAGDPNRGCMPNGQQPGVRQEHQAPPGGSFG
jgi:hypothetical protein